MATIIMRNIENRFVIEDLQDALTAARRAEAAAWNYAIEAAAVACDERGLTYAVPSIAATVADDCAEDIRALRREPKRDGDGEYVDWEYLYGDWAGC